MNNPEPPRATLGVPPRSVELCACEESLALREENRALRDALEQAETYIVGALRDAQENCEEDTTEIEADMSLVRAALERRP